MTAESVNVPYTGLTPGADANTYVLFSTATAFPAPYYAPMNRLKRLQVGLSNSQAGTYNWYKSNTRATPVNGSSTNAAMVWTQIGTAAIAAGATAENTNDFLIAEYADFKLEWVNGGVAQATWVPNLSLAGERVKSV